MGPSSSVSVLILRGPGGDSEAASSILLFPEAKSYRERELSDQDGVRLAWGYDRNIWVSRIRMCRGTGFRQAGNPKGSGKRRFQAEIP